MHKNFSITHALSHFVPIGGQSINLRLEAQYLVPLRLYSLFETQVLLELRASDRVDKTVTWYPGIIQADKP